MSKNYISFNGGISTEPEVNKLIEEIGIPKPGEQISYAQLEALLGLKRSAGRWHSIITAWRKRLERKHNIFISAVPNEGFEVLSNSGRINLSAKNYKGGLRRLRSAVEIVQATDRAGLSDEEKRAADHIQKTGASLHLAAQTAARELRYPELDAGENGQG